MIVRPNVRPIAVPIVSGVTVGPELLVSGDFSSATGWTLGTGWAISGGRATATTPGATSSLWQPVSIVSGRLYLMTIDVPTMAAAGLVVRAYSGGSIAFAFGATITAPGTYTRLVPASVAADSFRIDASAAASASVESVSLREVPY